MLAFNRSVVCARFVRYIVIYTFAFIGGKEFLRKVSETVRMVFIHGYKYPFPIESSTQKKLYKATIWHNTSWKAGNGQLGKFYFPVGKIFFLSWKIIFFQLGTFRSPFWRVFVRFWPLMAIISKHQKCFTFSFLFWQKKIFFALIYRICVICVPLSEDISLTQIPQIPPMLLLFREINVRHNAKD